MYEGEGRPDENFHKPVARDGESDNFKVPESIDYDDPRVRSIVENKGVSVEEAIMEIRAGGGVPPIETE
jgi:hypothetical protein